MNGSVSIGSAVNSFATTGGALLPEPRIVEYN